MKSFASFLGMLLVAGMVTAQNPVSYPRDTSSLSKPELNFEVFWHTFEDNYAFFTLRKIDWHKVYKTYRPLVTKDLSDDSLYTMLSKMIAPFHDDHINLIVPGVKQFSSRKRSQFVSEFPTDSLRRAFRELIDEELVANGFSQPRSAGPSFRGYPLFTYTTTNSTGYLRFNRCFVDPEAESIPDAAAAALILDSVFQHFTDVHTLIIDVRDNMGGNDEFSYEVAGRFTRSRVKGMTVKTRIQGAGYETFGPGRTGYIIPKGSRNFSKPVVVLTNDKTASAGDVFAALMRQLPQVKLIGSRSLGIYSDMYGFTLPNGWLASLSHQRYYNNKMICYEGSGTPVEITVLNTRNNLATRTDPVLRMALQKRAATR